MEIGLMHNEQAEALIYIDHLEAHGVALVGDEASQHLVKDILSSSSFPEVPEVIPAAIKEFIRCQDENRSYVIPSNEDKSQADTVKRDAKVSLVWGGRDIPLEADAVIEDGNLQWSANLSEFSYEDALLEEHEPIKLKLKMDDEEVNLYNAPYLLSLASLSATSRSQLFSHLSVYVRFIYSVKTNTLLVDLYGDDSKTTRYQFAGWCEDSENELMLAHWFKRIGHLICINEPLEVRGSNA